MAVPTDAHPRSEAERTQAAHSRADRTAVAIRSVSATRYGFGPPVEPNEIGTLGPYRVVRRLGKGGMGAVYAAIDTRLDRKLALKVMLPECAADADAKERFLREARAAAQVAHDNVVTVYEADERDGVPYIAMQFLEGYPLDEFLKKKGSPTVPQTLRLARETASGLAAAHKLGLVHRDIKPGNLWLEAPNGRVKVLDFGLAKTVHTDTELTQSGVVVGTPAYMSPEQARGKKVDERSDLFSLGAVLYRLCTGRLPFDGPTTMAVLMALGTEDPLAVQELNPAVPESLAALVHQLLAKDPDERPQSAAEVAKWLQAIANSNGASQVVVTPAPRVVYVSAETTAPVEVNPFADLGTTEIESPETVQKAPPARKSKRRSRVPLLWLAAGLAGLFAVAAVSAAIVFGTRKGAEPKAEPLPVAAPKSKPMPVKEAGTPDPERATAGWVLSLNGTVQINGEEREIRFEDDLPADRFALTGINLTDRPIADADLARLKDCPSLTRLVLHGTRVTDAGVAHLKPLPQLAHLSLAHCRITDAGFAHVKSFPGLQSLWAQDTAVSDAGLEALKELHALTRVDLSGTRVAGPGLVNLSNTKGLTLFINGTPITDANMVHLKGLTGLTELGLDGTGLSDAGLPSLHPLKGLSLLYVRHTRATLLGLTQLHPHLPACRIECNGGYIVPVDPNRVVAEWALALGGTVRLQGQTQALKAAAELPKGLFALAAVSVTNRPVEDTDLARLKFCAGLQNVALNGAKVTDAGLAHLKQIPGLRWLDVSAGQVTDAGLAHLRNLKQLESLHLGGSAVTDAGLVHLKGLTALNALHLGGTKVTDAGLAHLKDLTVLRDLNLSAPGVKDAGLADLKGHTHLTALNLNGTAVTDAGLAHLAGLTELNALHLGDTKVTDLGLAHIKDMTALRSLELSRTRVTGPGLVHTRGFSYLEGLFLTGAPVTDEGFAHLTERHTIKHLYADGTRLTDAGVAHIRKIRGLFVVNLSGTAVTDAGLMQLSEHGGVPYPTLNNTRVTARGLHAFHAVAPWRQIVWNGTVVRSTEADRAAARWALAAGGKVQVNGEPNEIVSEAALPKDKFALTAVLLNGHTVADYELLALKHTKELTNLGLRNSGVTDAGLAHLKHLPNLRRLRLDGTGVTDAGLDALKSTPLTILDVRSTAVTQKRADAFRAAVPGCKVEWGASGSKK